jgi:saccharopine dehydrogenase-like NADP-dependent oxidoreductase
VLTTSGCVDDISLLIASTGHIIELLVQRNYEIITTVRSEDKAAQIRNAHPNAKITVVLVPDIAQPDAFDEVVKVPGLDIVLHSKHYSRSEIRSSKLTINFL